jgi:branched-chain amino acid transport system permease protein
MKTVQGKILVLLFLLAILTGCSTVDLNQAALCEEVARILFAGSDVGTLASTTDPSAAHAVVTSVDIREASGADTRHRVSCGFESSNAKSADLMSLTRVATDVEGRLGEERLAELRSTLERRGIYWKVSWVPHLGPPHGELAPLSPRVALLYFLQLVVNALTYGSIIALLAIGYTVISGVIGVFNLAFGDIYMIGAFVTVAVIGAVATLGVGPFALCVVLALPLTMAIAAGYSAVSDRLVFRPLRQSSPQMPLIASIGLSMVLQNFVFVTVGSHDLWLTAPVASGFVVAQADGFSLYANREQIALFAMTLLFVGAAALIMARTSFGRAQRACAQDRRMAALLGIDVDRVIVSTFAFGGAFAAAGGLIAATYYGSVHYVMGVMMGLKAITAAVVGGTGNVKGAVLGGFTVALLESLAAGYFFAAYRDVVVFALLILLLIFRPQGILGEA